MPRIIARPTTRLKPLWGDRRFDPIYQRAEELGLPIFYHGGEVA
jgi:hypothetical protein